MEWEPTRAMHLAALGLGRFAQSAPVNSLISDLSVVLDSGANSPSGMLHASKGIADVSG